MAETNFAKAFLTTLDQRPVRRSADFVEDPKNYPARAPVRTDELHCTIGFIANHRIVYPAQNAESYEQAD